MIATDALSPAVLNPNSLRHVMTDDRTQQVFLETSYEVLKDKTLSHCVFNALELHSLAPRLTRSGSPTVQATRIGHWSKLSTAHCTRLAGR